MPKFTPGVFGRVFQTALDVFQSGRLAAESKDNLRVLGDGRIVQGDGSVTDLTAPNSLAWKPPHLFTQYRDGEIGYVIKAPSSGSTLAPLQELQDGSAAAIWQVWNAGGGSMNDWINIYMSIFPTVYGFRSNIYGAIMFGHGSGVATGLIAPITLFAHPGPPGNRATWADATFSVYDGNRGPAVGQWTTITNATLVGDGTYTSTQSPTNYLGGSKVTVTTAGTVTVTMPLTGGCVVVPSEKYFLRIAGRVTTGSTRNFTLGIEWINAANGSISVVTGVAAALPTAPGDGSVWGVARVGGIAPAGAVRCRPVVTIAAAALAEVYAFNAFGLWDQTTTASLYPSAWSPPYVFGTGTGANLGDVYLQTDLGSTARRIWAAWAGGVPGTAAWSRHNDELSLPYKLNWFGHSYLTTLSGVDSSFLLPNIVAGLLHIESPKNHNMGRGGSSLCAEGAQTGGTSTVTQWIRKTNRGAPYMGKDGTYAFLWGVNDLGSVSSAGGATEMTKVNGPGTTPSNGAFVNCLRSAICRARAASVRETYDSAWVITGGGDTGAVDYASDTNADPGTGGSFHFWNTSSSGSFTFTIPADFDGVEVDLDFIGPGSAGSNVLVYTGTLFSVGGITNPGTVTSDVITPIATNAVFGHGRYTQRFTGLSKANAGQTIIGTIGAITGGINLDCAYLVGNTPNMVLVYNTPRLRDAAAYSTPVTYPYWHATAGASGDGDVATLNTNVAAMLATFTSEVVLVDADQSIDKTASYYNLSDGLHLNEDGVQQLAEVTMAAVNNVQAKVNWQQVNMDNRDVAEYQIGTYTVPGSITTGLRPARLPVHDYYEITRAYVMTGGAPAGANVVVDVYKNGATIYPTNTGNRPAVVAGTNAQDGANQFNMPDLTFLKPNDYLQINVVQTGSTSPGSDLVVAVFGRKIAPP